MSTPPCPADAPRPNHPARWAVFEERFGKRARASDVDWMARLTPAGRLDVVEALLTTVRTVREAAGQWAEVDARAWQAALDERRRLVAAFHRLDEVRGGHEPAANTG
jgi:hypothetical protein